MTDEQIIKVIRAIVDDFYKQQGGSQAALGTLSAINAVLRVDDENEKPKENYSSIFDDFFKDFMLPKDNGDKGNV